jgi:hypothetical protein
MNRAFLFACLAFLVLHGRSLIGPVIFYDDFQILSHARTWQRTWDSLWLPQNEHAMPLGRLLCFVLEQTAGQLTRLPYLTCWMGPLGLLLAVGMLSVFVRRELGHPFYAVVAVILFAVTSVYHQAVWWFAAAFAVLSLDTLLLGLLAAQSWRMTRNRLYLVLSAVACLLAPAWFALGILAGPLSFVYLLFVGWVERSETHRGEHGGSRFARLTLRKRPTLQTLHCLWPLLGTVLFLAISLPRTSDAILHAGHYGEETATQAFDLWVGMGYTARSLVDNLFLGLVGVCGLAMPIWLVVPILLAILALGIWWWRQATEHRTMALGLAFIATTYMLCYSARARWDYEQMVTPAFSRYHLLPHLGLVLYFIGGLTGRAGRWFVPENSNAMNARQRRFAYLLISICFVVQLPRGLLCSSPTGWTQFAEVRAQQDALRRIEEVDARCRAHRIDIADARNVLGRFPVPLSYGEGDGWDFLIGGNDPRPMPPDQVHRLLDGP